MNAFRPGYNAARLNHSARRLALPELSHGLRGLSRGLRARRREVGSRASTAPRPFMLFASEGSWACTRRALSTTTSSVLPRVPTSGRPVGRGHLGGARYPRRPRRHRQAAQGGRQLPRGLPAAPDPGRGQRLSPGLLPGLPTRANYLEELGGMNMFVVMADG